MRSGARIARPGALAAICDLSLHEVRPHLKGFERKRYTNPTMMYAALNSLGVLWSRAVPLSAWPERGLVRIQWHGPWMAPGVPVRVRYPHTHWIGTTMLRERRFLFDFNCMSNGSGWVSLFEWSTSLVPWLLECCEPKADGAWSVTHGLNIPLPDAASTRPAIRPRDERRATPS